jgi:hypothetical protein
MKTRLHPGARLDLLDAQRWYESSAPGPATCRPNRTASAVPGPQPALRTRTCLPSKATAKACTGSAPAARSSAA